MGAKIIFFLLFLFEILTLNWTSVDEQIVATINGGHFSGCELSVLNNNSTLYRKAYGSIEPRFGLFRAPVEPGMKYDINYLTQVIGINSILMQMYDQAKLNVTDRVSRHLFDFDNNGKRYITIENMLIHNSGLQATFNDTFPNTPADLLKKINNLKLQYKTEAKYEYSELGYVVLGQMVSKMLNKTIEESLFEIFIFAGLRDTGYHPTTSQYKIVPSGYNQGVTRGTPTNKIAKFLNNAAGNAGLFTTVDEMTNYMHIMLNKGKNPPFSKVFSEEVVDLFTTKIKEKSYNNTRAYGWDTVPSVNPPCGHKFSASSFGLTDPTGSYIWADKSKNISIILLANGQYPAGKKDHSEAQGKISDAIMTVLGY